MPTRKSHFNSMQDDRPDKKESDTDERHNQKRRRLDHNDDELENESFSQGRDTMAVRSNPEIEPSSSSHNTIAFPANLGNQRPQIIVFSLPQYFGMLPMQPQPMQSQLRPLGDFQNLYPTQTNQMTGGMQQMQPHRGFSHESLQLMLLRNNMQLNALQQQNRFLHSMIPNSIHNTQQAANMGSISMHHQHVNDNNAAHDSFSTPNASSTGTSDSVGHPSAAAAQRRQTAPPFGNFSNDQMHGDNTNVPIRRSKMGLTGRPPVSIHISCDNESLSEYQCLARQQIELYEANEEDIEAGAQGRNRPIVLGQVGIRCMHCAILPPKHRARGAMYYPRRLEGLYQAAQNMIGAHLHSHCQNIPDKTREELDQLRGKKTSAGGGKRYWADGVRALGVYECDAGLRFEPT